ncbi:desmin-like [Engraulis encrasicolus]|uniref:desmin-like n=1 Tax=Engraulis encrasicolus TaxID=184585 RepID=UPI002FCF592C
MSRSPERISSYRRYFEECTTAGAATSTSLQMRVSSPSPVRREVRSQRGASYSRSSAAAAGVMAVGRRAASASASRSSTASKSLMVSGGAGAVGMAMCGGQSVDLDAVAAENQEFRGTRTSQRKEMIVLNDRLAAYIEKVRSLESQNKVLETEIEGLTNRFLKPTGLRMLYEEQLRELRNLAEQMRRERDLALAAKDATAAELEMIKVKYEEAIELRKKAEMDIENFRPDVDAATSSRIALEKQLENLQFELEFLKRIQREEIEELMKQIYAATAVSKDGFGLPDLSSALQQIQSEYDTIAAKNLQEMDSWYNAKYDDLNSKSTSSLDKMRGAREQLATAKMEIQGKERDRGQLQTKLDGLEAKIAEAQARNKKELEALQARIEALQLEIKSTKGKMAKILLEYQELLNVKMSLEIEITTYRKLIEGEDIRIAGVVQKGMSAIAGSSSMMSSTMAVGMASGFAMSSGMSVSAGMSSGMAGAASAMASGISFAGAGINGSAAVAAGAEAGDVAAAVAGEGGHGEDLAAGVADGTGSEAGVADRTGSEAGIADGTGSEAGIADGTVSEAGVADGTVSEAGVADGTVSEAGVADGTGSEAGVADGTGSEAGVADGTVSEAGVADGTVSEAGVADGTGSETGTGSEACEGIVEEAESVGEPAAYSYAGSEAGSQVAADADADAASVASSMAMGADAAAVAAATATSSAVSRVSAGQKAAQGHTSTVEQAVEVIERKTLLIRTVMNNNEVLEHDTQEHNYLIKGAANEE